ncbi:hypothetical protein PAEPH01_1270 [Pancytospora epiphaga]|nr:hypothetical protein PAEPH01_1270 [Pancytospora epiphaga]
MEIQTTLIQTLLYCNMICLGLLMQPYFPAIRKWLTKFYLKSLTTAPLYHVIFVLYCMVLVIFLDSIFKKHTVLSPTLLLQSERNFYLSGFTLFLGLIFRRLCRIMSEAVRTDEANKDTLKQHGNSMVFVSKVIEDVKKEKEKNSKLEEKLKELENIIEMNRGVLAETENNKKAYLKLKDKYEKLVSEKYGERRKDK